MRLTLTARFLFPRGVAVDDQGYIIVGDSGNNRIQVFEPDGTFLKAFGAWGSQDGEFKGKSCDAQVSCYYHEQKVLLLQTSRQNQSFVVRQELCQNATHFELAMKRMLAMRFTLNSKYERSLLLHHSFCRCASAYCLKQNR